MAKITNPKIQQDPPPLLPVAPTTPPVVAKIFVQHNQNDDVIVLKHDST